MNNQPHPRQSFVRNCLGIIAVLWISCLGAYATTIDPITWEELSRDCDFHGVVECIKAGGIVAEYEVLESWRGPAAGEILRIQSPVGYWGGQYPVTRVGDRMVVMAFKRDAPCRITSFSSGGEVPLWWRNLPYDYSMTYGCRESAKDNETIAKTRAKVIKFYAMTASQNEAVVLKAVVNKRLTPSRDASDGIKAEYNNFSTALDKCVEAQDVLELLFAYDAALHSRCLQQIIVESGGRVVKGLLEDGKLEGLPFEEKELKRIIACINSRINPKDIAPDEAKMAPSPPTKEQLDKWRLDFAGGEEEKSAFWTALRALTVHDPAPVAAWLSNWEIQKINRRGYPKNPLDMEREKQNIYSVGSYFGFKCGKDRKEHLAKLLSAKEVGVRVSAAVYLCFEDLNEGEKALMEFSKIEGYAGWWAALTLARRGHKDQVDRLFAMFDIDRNSRAHSFDVENLKGRIHELLSNSASASGIPQPPRWAHPSDAMTLRMRLQAWWDKYKDKIILADPWLDELAERKID